MFGTNENSTHIQAIYLDYVIKKAQRQSVANIDKLVFDPQGRVLVDVLLGQADELSILEAINQKLKTQFKSFKDALLGLPTKNTTVSLDVRFNNKLLEKYKEYLGTSCYDLLENTPKGSVIALHQEYYFHLALVSRVYQKYFKLNAQEVQKVHNEVVNEFNSSILVEFKVGVQKATKKNQIDIDILNRHLDQSRTKLMSKAHKLLVERVVTAFNLEKKALDTEYLKHIASITTATVNDVIHTDFDLGLATWIEGNQVTAHDRKLGPVLANRQIVRLPINKDSGELLAQSNAVLLVRIPSPVVKDNLADDVVVRDVKNKLVALTKLYPPSDGPCTYVYNRFTALNDLPGDTNGNLQSASTLHILKGVHQFNSGQLKKGTNAPWILVENISVNGFGEKLNNQSSSLLVLESTLMAEMALCTTVYDVLDETDKKKVDLIREHYQKYLSKAKEEREPLFYESSDGKGARLHLYQLIAQWKKKVSCPDNLDIVRSTKFALIKIMANQLHYLHKYSILVQTLSVFAQKATFFGCKSGNERTQMINGRVAVLATQNLAKFLESLATAEGKSEVDKAAFQLNTQINTLYNQLALESGASLISLIDQGATAKIEPKQLLNVSRNNAEVDKHILSFLHQKYAGKMQAHKGMVQKVVDAWGETSRPWYALLSNGLKNIVKAIKQFFAWIHSFIGLFSGYMLRSVEDEAELLKERVEEGKRLNLSGKKMEEQLGSGNVPLQENKANIQPHYPSPLAFNRRKEQEKPKNSNFPTKTI